VYERPDAALKLCGRSGSEVVTTPMTCVATNTPIDNLAHGVWRHRPETASIDVATSSASSPRPPGHHVRGLAGTPCDLDASMLWPAAAASP